MEKRLIILVVLFFGIISHAQVVPQNKWYTFSYGSDKLVEYNFNSSTLISNQSTSVSDTVKIIKIINQNGNLYYVLYSVRYDKNIIMILSEFKPDISFIQLPAPEEITYFNNLDSALFFIESDTLRRRGMTFYAEKEVSRLKTLPDATTISKQDLKKYLLALNKSKEDFGDFRLKNSKYFNFMLFINYVYNQSKALLAVIGYNPFISDKDLDEVINKYKDDPELGPLVKEASNF